MDTKSFAALWAGPFFLLKLREFPYSQFFDLASSAVGRLAAAFAVAAWTGILYPQIGQTGPAVDAAGGGKWEIRPREPGVTGCSYPTEPQILINVG